MAPAPYGLVSAVPHPRRPLWLWQVPGWGVLAASVAVLFRFTAEDAYIVGRYAETLVRDGVLRYNPAEPVNALTSPLHALLAAALAALTGDPVGACKWVGAGCLVGVGAGVVRMLRPDAVAQGAALLIVAAPCVAMWSVGGLETPLLMAGVLALAAVSLRASGRVSGQPTRGDVLLASLLAALCVVVRYDAALFAAPVTLGLWLRRPRDAAAGLALGTAVVGGWMGYAFAVYGDVLPTSFYVKTPGAGHLAANALYVGQYLVLVGVVPVVAVAALLRRGRAAVAPVRPWREDRDGRVGAGLWSGLAVVGAYALTAATTHMMFGFRLGVPYVPVLALLAGRALARSLREAPRGLAAPRWPAVLALGALAAAQLAQLAVVAAVSVNGAVWSPTSPVALAPAEHAGDAVYEYTRVGAASYTDGFMGALETSARDIRADWARTPHPGRPLRLFTYAGGVVPYRLPEAYVFEALVSHRRGCAYPLSLALSADYVHVLTPGHGTAAAQLPLPGSSRYRLVSDVTVRFNGARERVQVYRNRDPLPNPLPARLHGACPPAAAEAAARIRAAGT